MTIERGLEVARLPRKREASEEQSAAYRSKKESALAAPEVKPSTEPTNEKFNLR